MVVNDLDLFRLVFGPNKADPVLIVDPDAVLAMAIARQALQSVPWRNAKIFEALSGIELVELASRHGPETLWASATSILCVLAVEYVFSALVSEGANHQSMIARVSCYVNERL